MDTSVFFTKQQPALASNLIFIGENQNYLKLKPVFETAGHSLQYLALNYTSSELEQIDIVKLEVAIIDLTPDKTAGFSWIKSLKSLNPDIQIVTISNCSSGSIIMEAEQQGAFWHLNYDDDPELLVMAIARAFIVFELANTNRSLEQLISTPNLPNESSNYVLDLKIFQQAQHIAASDSSVLITGETGTGKTTMARWIHNQSNRCNGPFISLSCASIPRDLLEAELFGVEKGAYTGAYGTRIGCLELANKGTLFLDEIGELPIDLQPKLLTFLQDQELRRLGSNRIIKIDARVITATNAELSKLVAQFKFRQDLYYRINVVELSMPPLRSCPSKISELAESLLKKIAYKIKKRPYTLTPAALAKLRNYSWPGNIRELENALERAVILSNDQYIKTEDLNLLISSKKEDAAEIDDRQLTLAEIEEQAIRKTLLLCKDDKVACAKILGVSIKTIYNKIRLYGITKHISVEI